APTPEGRGSGLNRQRATPVYGISRDRLKRAGLCHLFRASQNHCPVSIRFSLFPALLSKRPPTPRRGYPGATTRSDKKHFSEKMAIGDGELSSTAFLWHNVNDSEDIESYKCIR